MTAVEPEVRDQEHPRAGAMVDTRRDRVDGGVPREIARGVAWLRTVMVNVYFLGERGVGDRGWVLVDCGIAGSAAAIAAGAAQRYGADARPAAIVLTHGHFDHVGALETLAERWDCPVYAHALEMPYITGMASYPPFDASVGGGAMSLLSPLYPRGPWDVSSRVRTLPADRGVPFAPGWRWIHTPGHSPGHVSLFRDDDRTLLAGDAVITTKQEAAYEVLVQRPEVRRPPAYATTDWQMARASVEALAALEPRLLATGHGTPLVGEAMRAGLHALATDFTHVGIPSRGRYVWQPAIADENGPLHVPPPVPHPALKWVAVAAVAAIAGLALAAWLRRDRDADEGDTGVGDADVGDTDVGEGEEVLVVELDEPLLAG